MIVLASASPRRRTLLAAAGWTFRVDPSGADESIDPNTEPARAAEQLAERKARDVANRSAPSEWVVGADTVVAVGRPADDGWDLLGKPESPAHARAMLRRLSRSRHQVVTGVAVFRGGGTGERVVDSETTWVTMREITDAEIDAYVASGEWEDKAGGYAIQENADAFVTSLEGGAFDNVVGLPVRLTAELVVRLSGDEAALGLDGPARGG